MCMNLDSQSILNEDLDDVCEDKLKVSDVKTLSSVLELDSNLGSGQADEFLTSYFSSDEIEDRTQLEVDGWKESK